MIPSAPTTMATSLDDLALDDRLVEVLGLLVDGARLFFATGTEIDVPLEAGVTVEELDALAARGLVTHEPPHNDEVGALWCFWIPEMAGYLAADMARAA